ncbi:MAG: nucleotidyltransferase family protein [Clostridia bacterium]|nr:nucleotidyltransferase family protein [Clostridia bacterium]
MSCLSEEYKFIIDAVKSAITNTPIDKNYENVNYRKVCSIALSHCISSLLSRALKLSSISVDEDILKKISASDKIMLMSSLARKNARENITKIFKENDVDFVLLKGANLQNLYPEKYWRYSCDIDVLVKEKDYEKSYKIFKNAGYDFDSRNDKHYVFTKKPYICVEIHKKLCSENNFFENVWQNTIEKDGSLVLKKEFELAYLVYHIAENFSKNAGIGIHSVTDIYLYIKNYKNEIDEKVLYDYLEKNGILKFYQSLKTLGEIWFENKESSEFYDRLTDFIISGNRNGNASNAASIRMNNNKPLFFEKILFMFSKIFLPYKDLKKIYPALEKVPFLLPVFWLIRIAGIVFRREHRSFQRANDIFKNTNKKSIENTKEIFKELDLYNKKIITVRKKHYENAQKEKP